MAPLNQNWKTLGKSCHGAAKAIGLYFNSLRTLGILPEDLELTSHRFCDLIRKVSQLPHMSVEKYRCGAYPRCICQDDPAYNLTSGLNNNIRHIKEQQKILICLDCWVRRCREAVSLSKWSVILAVRKAYDEPSVLRL